MFLFFCYEPKNQRTQGKTTPFIFNANIKSAESFITLLYISKDQPFFMAVISKISL